MEKDKKMVEVVEAEIMERSKPPHPGYKFGNSVIENLKAMSEQRSLEDVAKECQVTFSYESGDIDPLRSALDHAKEYDVKCLVIQDDWFMIVPSMESDLKGWTDCLRIWESIDEQRRIAESR